MDIQQLEELLVSIGYDKQKRVSGKKVAVLINGNRVEALEHIKKSIKGSVYDKTPGSDSSSGRVKIKGFEVLAKPASKQGTASAGVENEVILVEKINKITKKKNPVNVVFKGKNKKYTINGCVKAEQVGADTSGRKKADVVLIDVDGVKYPISVKKDNAETWESADSYFGATAEAIIKKAIRAKKTKLVSEGSFFKIEPNIAVEATAEEKKNVVFGSDIAKNGAVITKTFSSTSFELEGDTLHIECSHIITKLADVTGDKDVYFLMRNDKTRKSIKQYPGIRVLASYKKRINKNVVIVSR